jgi:hypothetical protein
MISLKSLVRNSFREYGYTTCKTYRLRTHLAEAGHEKRRLPRLEDIAEVGVSSGRDILTGTQSLSTRSAKHRAPELPEVLELKRV